MRELGTVDLNLLVALDALLRETNVTRAATKLGVTQSAMSHTLNRLRAHFDDPLLVRKGAEMIPTPLGESLAKDLVPILADMEVLLGKRSRFDAKSAVRRFTILASDYAQIVVLPKLLEGLASAAPGIDLAVRNVAHPERALAERGFDLMVGPAREEPSSSYRQRLFVDRLVCVGRKGTLKTLDFDAYLDAKHVLVSPRGHRGGIIDDALAKLGKERRVVLELPHFLVAPLLIDSTDYLLTIPERLARAMPNVGALDIVPLPFDVPPVEFVQLWHARNHDDEAHVWLRARIAEVTAS